MCVALLVRAWIEIHLTPQKPNVLGCRSPRESVNWNYSGVEKVSPLSCRSPRESVNWNCCMAVPSTKKAVALLVRAWIEIFALKAIGSALAVALLVRAWIEIPTVGSLAETFEVALLVRAWIEIYREQVIKFEQLCRSPRESVNWNNISFIQFTRANLSLSSWERELKGYVSKYVVSPASSLSSWERELKFLSPARCISARSDALLVRAWIDIC